MRDSQITGKERLEHIQQAIADIEAFTKDSSKETYLNDPVLIHATLFKFAIIGEAIIHVDLPELKKIVEQILANEF
ncbi:MAG: DUF86 domain-containing protein [Bacteroidota bacterium]|nr:DUF86 domain-containing protein [Bacteroidota bacterium]